MISEGSILGAYGWHAEVVGQGQRPGLLRVLVVPWGATEPHECEVGIAAWERAAARGTLPGALWPPQRSRSWMDR